MNTQELQQELSRFVDREVIYCVSTLISELRRLSGLDSGDEEALHDLAYVTDYEEAAKDAGWRETPTDGQIVFIHDDHGEVVVGADQAARPWEALLDIVEERGMEGMLGRPLEADEDAEDLLSDADWQLVDCSYYNAETGEQEDADDWQDLCQKALVDTSNFEHEVYEHWIVSSWLGDKLSEKGHTVREVLGLLVWGRPTTGQAISMDGVIEEIYRELHQLA